MIPSLLNKSRHVVRMNLPQFYTGFQHVLSKMSYYFYNNDPNNYYYYSDDDNNNNGNNGWFQQLLQEQPQLILDTGIESQLDHDYNGTPWMDDIGHSRHNNHNNNNNNNSTTNALLENLSIWLAVPKQKISHQKKRMKTTLRTRIPIRKNIMTDPRTGELTLQHHLPYNWKNYLPNAMIGKNHPSNNNTTKSE